MRRALLPLILLAVVVASPAKAAAPLTFEVIDNKDKVIERMDVPADQIADVASGFDQAGRPVLNIRLASAARIKFGEFTKAHLYKRMRVRVGDTIVTPGARIMSPILGGSLQLSGLDPKEIQAAKKGLGR